MHLMRNLSRVGRDGCGVPSLVPSLWDRVVADLARKRMAPQQSLQAQPNPTRHAKRSEEHTSELQSRLHLVCRLLLEKKKKTDETINDSIDHSCSIYTKSACRT